MYKTISAPKKLIAGYFICCLLGGLLLALPVVQLQPISWVDSLFVSVSSISTTGLIPFQIIDNYNMAGQFIILLLIQLGGIGYMSVAAFTMFMIHHKWKPEEIVLLKNDLGLPSHYNFLVLIKIKIVLALAVEILGALVLWYQFSQLDVANPLWNGLFHSVSAFCTAGVSLFPNGLEDFKTDIGVNITIACLCYIGSIGFIVFSDLWQVMRYKRKRLTFTSQIILKISTIVIVLGAALFLFTENSIKELSLAHQFVIALFHAISAVSTAGFNTIDLGLLSIGNILLLSMLMIIGASPTGTGGGLKITTVAIVFAHMKSSFQGRRKTVLQNTIVPSHRIRLALATFTFYLLTLFVGVLCLSYLYPALDFERLLFETVSAFSTVGLTLNITYHLGTAGKVVLIFMMFAGRIGYLALGNILFGKHALLHNEQTRDITI